MGIFSASSIDIGVTDMGRWVRERERPRIIGGGGWPLAIVNIITIIIIEYTFLQL